MVLDNGLTEAIRLNLPGSSIEAAGILRPSQQFRPTEAIEANSTECRRSPSGEEVGPTP